MIVDMRQEHAGQLGPLGRPERITLHWTAGSHTQTFDHYHFCVRGDGQVVQTLSLQYIGSHCWKRNTGNVGVSMCAMAPGWPITDRQREATARLVAELCGVLGIDLAAVHDHAHYARLDGYFPERWDCGEETPLILKKARWYRQQLISGKITNSLIGAVR